VKETAEILGKEISNVKVIQSRGFARLRKAMGLESDEDPGNLLASKGSRSGLAGLDRRARNDRTFPSSKRGSPS